MHIYNHTYLKNKNRAIVLECVYKDTDVNRNYIAEKTGLSGAAVTKIINSLISEKFLSEDTYYSEKRGRRARYLRISRNEFGVVVLHVSRSHLISTVIELNGNILYSNEYGYSYQLIDENLFRKIIDETMDNFPALLQCLGCVCISPGIVVGQKQSEEKEQAPFYWNFDNLKKYLEKRYCSNLFFANDSNAALLGELWFGSARNEENVVLYNIGKGIGAGACANGHLLMGYNNSSIEIGHVSINFQGSRCICGNRGCLELYTSVDNWERKLKEKEDYREMKNIPETLFFQANNGNKKALQEIMDYASLLAEGALTLVNMFSPKKIILTTNEADYMNLPLLITKIEQEISSRLYSIQQGKTIEIVPSLLRGKGYLLGGLITALQNIFGSTQT